MSTFTVTTTRTHTFRQGWGVFVDTIYDWNEETNEPNGVSEIGPVVVCIVPDAVAIVGGASCISTDFGWVPVENFANVGDLTQDDSHDLRTRWFATREEAESHAAFVRSTWDNPAPWVSFIVDDAS